MIMLIGIQLQLDGYLLKKYLFLVVLRLHCRAGFSPPVVRAAGRGGSPLAAVCGILTAAALSLWSAGSRALGFSSCGKWAQYWLRASRTGSQAVLHGLYCSTAGEIFLNLGSNPPVLHCQEDSLPLSHLGNLMAAFLSSF